MISSSVFTCSCVTMCVCVLQCCYPVGFTVEVVQRVIPELVPEFYHEHSTNNGLGMFVQLSWQQHVLWLSCDLTIRLNNH